ncbi:hypothetical protein LDENG_00061420 [Lucifuga dentata]|nr:hypothetical protein LDENG_00061420 [Lucifuga dentata]
MLVKPSDKQRVNADSQEGNPHQPFSMMNHLIKHHWLDLCTFLRLTSIRLSGQAAAGLLVNRIRIPAVRTPCGALMHPFQWCNGCFCGLGLVYSNKSCTMPPITFQDLPLNIYMVIFGTGIFVFILSLIFCCYFISKLRHQAQSERFGYREVVLKGDPKKLNLHGQTCAVCLEDFKVKDELGVLPCQHAFHRKCLVKWLEVRCVCPMCNKPIAGPPEQHHSIGTLLDELV